MTTRGERLRSYLLAQTGGGVGWQAALVAKAGVKRQTISKWTNARFDGYPDLETLSAVAGALGVRLSEVIAVLEDEPAAVIDERTREALRQEIEAALDERLGPRREARGRAGAA